MPTIERKAANAFDQELLDLYDYYVHGHIDRRTFLDRASKFAVGGLTALALLEMLSPQYALAAQVPKEDARVKTEYLKFPSPAGHGEGRGLFARPANATGKLPGVVVVHENRGLNPYIEDVARRVALAGFVAFAPDALYPSGGYPGNDDEGRNLQGKLDRNKVIVTVDRHGNTSAASVPLALDEAVRDGRIQRGQKVLVEGVGGGFTWGAALLEF